MRIIVELSRNEAISIANSTAYFHAGFGRAYWYLIYLSGIKPGGYNHFTSHNSSHLEV
jgi:hypothetical protein